VVVPNGSDHVAMQRAAGAVRGHLDGGGALFCFDGWFTPWVPGNRWVMDNSRPPGTCATARAATAAASWPACRSTT
jgi:hypothetical protein